MTLEQLHAVLKQMQLKADKDGSYNLPEGSALTLHAAHAGASLNVQRIESVRFEGDMIFGRSTKKELFALACGDVFAVAIDTPPGAAARRAGFGA
jgi:hypothetical protein